MTLTNEDLRQIKLGMRYRGGYLVQQAGYTLGVAAVDEGALAPLLPAGYLAQIEALRAEVQRTAGDKAVAAEESKHATSSQDDAVREGKVWRRRVAARARRAQRMGADVPAALIHVGRTDTVPALLSQLQNDVSLLEAHGDALSVAGDPAPLLAQGRDIQQRLQSADDEQETKRLEALPAAVKTHYLAKGRLYTALKIVHDAGHELWADNTAQAARYNLDILYRNGRRRTPAVEAPPNSATATG